MKTLLNARFLTGIVALAVLASALVIGRPILAGGGEVPEHADELEAVTVTDPDEMLWLQARTIASQEGVSVAGAFRVLDHQRLAQVVIEKVASDYPDGFAGAIHSGGFDSPSTTILFKGVVPNELQTSIDSVSAVSIQGGRKYSPSELSQRSTAVFSALTGAGITGIATSVDIVNERIEIQIEPSSHSSAELLAIIREEVPKTLGKDLGRIAGGDIHVKNVEHSLAIETQHSYGGDWLNVGSTNSCTSGFSIRETDGSATGVLSAGHCYGLTKYQTQPGETYDVDNAESHRGVNGDYRWLTTTHSELGYFYYYPTARLSVTGSIQESYMAYGTWICNFGRATNEQICRAFYSSGICAWQYAPSPMTYVCNLSRVTGGGTTGGDSGSPWYSGGTAWGIHTGELSGNALFTSVSRAGDGMNVAVILP